MKLIFSTFLTLICGLALVNCGGKSNSNSVDFTSTEGQNSADSLNMQVDNIEYGRNNATSIEAMIPDDILEWTKKASSHLLIRMNPETGEDKEYAVLSTTYFLANGKPATMAMYGIVQVDGNIWWGFKPFNILEREQELGLFEITNTPVLKVLDEEIEIPQGGDNWGMVLISNMDLSNLITRIYSSGYDFQLELSIKDNEGETQDLSLDFLGLKQSK